MVAGTSAMRSGVMRSTARHLRHTRVGGRCRVPHAWHRLPVKPNFHASARNAGGAAGARGAGPRGGLRLREPPPRGEPRRGTPPPAPPPPVHLHPPPPPPHPP